MEEEKYLIIKILSGLSTCLRCKHKSIFNFCKLHKEKLKKDKDKNALRCSECIMAEYYAMEFKRK